MAPFVNAVFNGFSLTSIILLTSLGLAVTFGLMRVINMAHGEFVMIGAYMTYLAQQGFANLLPPGAFSLYYPAALCLAFAVTFALGCLMEKLVVSRLYGREIDSLLATGGLSLVFQQGARNIFGAQGVNVTAPAFLTGGLTVGGCTFSYNRMFIILLAVAALAAIWLALYRTNFGLQMRAVMENRPMAQCMGINSRRVDNLTFGLGSGLAGLAGCSVALLGSIDAALGQNYIVNSFMAVVLGGVGKLLGAVLGASVIGFAGIGVENFTSSSIAKAVVLLIIILFLQKKPQGLFAIRSRSLEEAA